MNDRVHPKSANVFTVRHRVTQEDRHHANRHRGAVLWFTGLSGAGKSTLAVGLEKALFERRFQVYTLDGDNVRQGLSADLGFAPEERAENIRRIGEVAALFAEAGMVVITAFISPYRADRERIRARHPGVFNEIFIDAPLRVCEGRDTKGLYRRARAGELAEFTGVSAPYEAPLAPELRLDTQHTDVQRCIALLLEYVEQKLAV